MGADSKIEWTHHTFNPVWGCTKVSQGCAHCYAETLAKRYGKDVWGPGERRTFGDKHWTEPLKWARDAEKAGERRRVFCGSMCDIFEDHPTTEAQLPRLMALIAATSCALDWLLLTKRPERAGHYLRGWLAEQDGSESPAGTIRPTWWLGTSVEDQATADLRIPLLMAGSAAIHFVSYEPALGPAELRFAGVLKRTRPEAFDSWPPERQESYIASTARAEYMARAETPDWVIVGGESGPGARPFDIAWARSAVEQCKAAGVACFVKQLGAHPRCNGMPGWPVDGVVHPTYWPKLRDRKGGDWAEWPEDLRVREFPEVGR